MEYLEMQWCRLYGCVPSQLDEQEVERMLAHLAAAEMEARVISLRAGKGRP